MEGRGVGGPISAIEVLGGVWELWDLGFGAGGDLAADV